MRKFILLLCLALSQITFSWAALTVSSKNSDSSSAYVSKEDEAMVKDAMKAFRSLSKAERKARMADAKQMMKEYKAAKANGSADTDSDTVLLAILAILLPPLAVYLHEKEVNTRFWLSLLLTLLFWIPGVIYALIVVLS